jgi:hypothetical protein
MSKRIALFFCFAALFAVPPAVAGQWDKQTTVTFGRPVELPGMVLPAGTYVFRLADVPSSRHVVQVFSADETHLYGTILALPNLRLKPTSETVLRFEERPRSKPEAIRAWFYPGDSFGQEFVYPKREAAELAQAAHVPVLAAEVKPTEQATELLETPVVAITPEKEEVEIAQAIEVPAEPPQVAAPAVSLVTPVEELPKTASPLPFVALLGLGSLGMAGAFRLIRRRVS